MDSLSRLLSLYPVSAALTVRCHFGAPWVLDHSQKKAGIAPYHVIISGTAMLNGGPHSDLPLKAGDIVVFPKGTVHSLHVMAEGEPSPLRELQGDHVVTLIGNDGVGASTEILCGEFRFDALASATLLLSLPEVMIVSSAGRVDLGVLQSLLTMLRLETDAVRPGTALVVSHLASALFAMVMRAWLERPTNTPGLFGLLAERRLHAAVNGMLAAPEQAWTLERMAAACNMSRATFARAFVRAAGAAPAAVLMQTRMARAAQSLAEGTRSVGEIAEAVGYQSEAAFNRAFKRSYGIGPGQYRRRARTLAEPGTATEPLIDGR
jgi:AraC family transcriptional activator of mtrCDE